MAQVFLLRGHGAMKVRLLLGDGAERHGRRLKVRIGTLTEA
jgi:hypothetical protein